MYILKIDLLIREAIPIDLIFSKEQTRGRRKTPITCYQIKEKDLETSITDFQKKNENMGKNSKNALARCKKKLYNFFIKAYECGGNNAYMIFIKMLTEPSKS